MLGASARPLRRLLICLLALCVGGLGPAVAAVVPRALNPGAEEETHSSAAQTIGGTVASSERPIRTTGHRGKANRGEPDDGRPAVRRAPAETRIAAVSLRTLQVRIQV